MNETKKRRLKITTETLSLTIIRMRGSALNSNFCPNCGENVSVFALSQAAFIFRVDEKFLERLFESNAIHAASQTALCGNSLIEYFK